MTLPSDENVIRRLRTAQILGFDNIGALRHYEAWLAHQAGLRV